MKVNVSQVLALVLFAVAMALAALLVESSSFRETVIPTAGDSTRMVRVLLLLLMVKA